MLHVSISLRALVFILLISAVALTGSDVARGAPATDNLMNVDALVFNDPGQNGGRDIRTQTSAGNLGGIRIYTGNTLTNPPTTAALQFYGNGHTVFGGQAFIDSGSSFSAAIIFRTAASGGVGERMRITAFGNVGIGTTNPTLGKLQVESDGVAIHGKTTGDTAIRGFADEGIGAAGVSNSGIGVLGNTNGSQPGVFQSFGTFARVVINSDTGTAANDNAGVRFQQGGTDRWSVAVHSTDGDFTIFEDDAGTNRLAIKGTGTNQGNVGIGNINPQDKLQVNGDIRVGTTGVNGCIKRADGNGIIGTCASDRALKKDIERLNPVLAQLAALQPSSFVMRTDEFSDRFSGSERSYGLIAQEVEQVLPELVATQDDGMKAVHYEMLPILTLEGVRELKAENDALREQVQTLEARLANIESFLIGGTPALAAAR
jgi:hypothetical protein